jgi:hypothetical protein
MNRAEIKRRLLAGEATPGVEDDVVWSVLAECRSESTGAPHRVVDLHEAASDRPLPGTDHHARMRTLIETRDTPRSDLKDNTPPATGSDYLPTGIDLAAAIRRSAEGYRAAGIIINPPVTRPKPVTFSESREDFAKRIADPIERAYIILSGRDR